MSAIAIPLPSRQVSRARTDEPAAGPASGRGAGQSSRRPRLRLVTDDFVPEVPEVPEVSVRRRADGARRPVSAPACVPAVPAMRRPAAPAALRDRHSELERLAPQHPAVRAAGLRRGAQQEEGRHDNTAQGARRGGSVSSRPREETVLSQAGLRLLRGGLAVVVAAFVLACCGLTVGALAGMVSPAPATAVAQVSADTTTTVVRPGQSLWDIAEASGASDVPGAVARIVELNDLQGTTVRAGQTLEVPAA